MGFVVGTVDIFAIPATANDVRRIRTIEFESLEKVSVDILTLGK